MTYNEFVNDVLTLVEECPKFWRKGQSVFNIVDAKYNVARDVQFIDGIDCFYDDNQIDVFLNAAYKRAKEWAGKYIGGWKNGDVEYIRKDALLNKLNDYIKDLSDGSLAGYYASLCYKDVVEMINEL